MTVDIGKKIEEVFESRNMKLTDFAEQLGTVRQNVYRIFRKSHVDTALLIKISRVLNHNFFQYYNPASSEMADLTGRLTDTTRELDLAKKEIVYLRKIIKLMEDKTELMQQLEVGR